MLGYIGRRLLGLIPVLFVVSIVIFSLIHLTPGDPARTMLGANASQERVEALRESMGLNRPLVVQYFAWIGNLFTGNLGESYFLRKSVSAAIADNAVATFQLALLAIVVAVVLSVPFGVIAARLRGRFFDRLVLVFTLLGMAVPSFVLGLGLMFFIGLKLRWFPVSGYTDPFEELGAGLRTLAMPALALGAASAALITRTARAATLDVLDADYIDAARSRGVSEPRLLLTHAFKNAGLPIITVVGLTFGSLVTGAVVTETIFNIPGLGQLLIQSIARRDYPVIQGVVLFITLLYLLVNLIVDLLYGLIDPRIRVSAKARS